MTISFKINCVPPKSTHQHNVRIFKNRNGKSFIGKSKTNKAAQAHATLLQLLHPYAPPAPLDGPLKLQVEWIYPYRKSEPKKNRYGSIPCNTRPDCDNLAKGLQDVMTSCGFWNDDSQIFQLDFSKWWGSIPGIGIVITEYERNCYANIIGAQDIDGEGNPEFIDLDKS